MDVIIPTNLVVYFLVLPSLLQTSISLLFILVSILFSFLFYLT